MLARGVNGYDPCCVSLSAETNHVLYLKESTMKRRIVFRCVLVTVVSLTLLVGSGTLVCAGCWAIFVEDCVHCIQVPPGTPAGCVGGIESFCSFNGCSVDRICPCEGAIYVHDSTHVMYTPSTNGNEDYVVVGQSPCATVETCKDQCSVLLNCVALGNEVVWTCPDYGLTGNNCHGS